MSRRKLKLKGSVFNKRAMIFGNKLYVLIKDSCGIPNTVFSPMSIYLAVGLTHLAANGRTKDEIKNVLKLADDDGENADSFYRTLCKYAAIPNILVANKLFVDSSITIKPKLLTTGSKYYKAEFENLNFTNKKLAAEKINAWSATKTNQNLQNSLPVDRIRDNTDMILMDLVCLKANWKYPFPIKNTTKETFWLNRDKNVQVEMMRNTLRVKLAALDTIDCKAGEIAFEGGDLSMLILLPNEKDGLAELERKLPGINIATFRNCLQTVDATIVIPKFRIQYKTELKHYLSQMGIEMVFDEEKATFAELFKGDCCDTLCVDRIVHHTIINVNENGIDSGPYKSSRPNSSVNAQVRELSFKVDHPFLFGIYSKRHRPFLFGRLRYPNPAAKFALGLTYLVLGSWNRHEIARRLEFFEDRRRNIDMLSRTLHKYTKNEHVHLACKLFVQKGLKIKPGALETFGKLSKHTFHRIDFTRPDQAAEIINDWVERKTKNKIRHMVKPQSIAHAVLVVVSAIHFNTNWETPFDREMSYDGDFWKNGIIKIKARMMYRPHMEVFYNELPELQCKSITLPFEDRHHSMLIVLPNSKNGIDSLEAILKQPHFHFLDFQKGSKIQAVNVTMPRFRFEFQSDLLHSLYKMNMKAPLENVDISPVFEYFGRLPISHVYHKTSIHVNEDGFEAVFTQDILSTETNKAEQDFIVSHPFMFAVLSKHSRLVFLGSVRGPS